MTICSSSAKLHWYIRAISRFEQTKPKCQCSEERKFSRISGVTGRVERTLCVMGELRLCHTELRGKLTARLRGQFWFSKRNISAWQVQARIAAVRSMFGIKYSVHLMLCGKSTSSLSDLLIEPMFPILFILRRPRIEWPRSWQHVEIKLSERNVALH